MNNTISYDSSTNKRLCNPSRAQSLAQNAVQRCHSDPSMSVQHLACRTIIGLGPGRSGSRSLSELLSFQTNVVHCEHEMIVPRLFPRSISGHILVAVASSLSACSSVSVGGEDVTACQPRNKQVKGSWGADRRLEWDVPKLARGEPIRSDEDEALWRVLRLLEQRHMFDGWVKNSRRGLKCADDDYVNIIDKGKPKKLGTKGWREYNNATNCNVSKPLSSSSDVTDKSLATQEQKQMHHQDQDSNTDKSKSTDTKPIEDSMPVIAAVSSVGLAYAHEYIALDPSVKILILLRPCEEVVASFMTKSKGRNHWQKHIHSNSKEALKVQRDKTWDNAFPNMSNDECLEVLSVSAAETNKHTPTTCTNEQHHRPDKIWAIRAYCKLYRDVANQLAQHYPDNVRVYDMLAALNDAKVQFELLKWCGFVEPVVDTRLHLNKKKKK